MLQHPTVNHLLLVRPRSAFLFSFWHAHFASFTFFTSKEKVKVLNFWINGAESNTIFFLY